ncbi:hypothetical protein B296_00053828, partial [Ensete ventricosum]
PRIITLLPWARKHKIIELSVSAKTSSGGRMSKSGGGGGKTEAGGGEVGGGGDECTGLGTGDGVTVLGDGAGEDGVTGLRVGFGGCELGDDPDFSRLQSTGRLATGKHLFAGLCPGVFSRHLPPPSNKTFDLDDGTQLSSAPVK